MVIFYKKWKKYNEIQFTKNKMDLNIRKMTNHPPSPDPKKKNNNNNNKKIIIKKKSTLNQNDVEFNLNIGHALVLFLFFIMINKNACWNIYVPLVPPEIQIYQYISDINIIFTKSHDNYHGYL